MKLESNYHEKGSQRFITLNYMFKKYIRDRQKANFQLTPVPIELILKNR